MNKVGRYILSGINALALILLLISAFSDFISPLRCVVFSYLGLFFPFILVGNILLLLCNILLRKWKTVGVSVLILLVCGSSIQTYFPLNRQTKNIPDDCIKLLTYNVMRFQWAHDDTPENPNPVLQYIRESEADIICIQEYGTSAQPDQLSQKKVKKALKDYPYTHFHELMFPYKNEIFGLALFSKFPILSTKEVPYKSDYNGSFVVELDVNGKRVTLINNHLESNKLSQEERDNYYRMTTDMNSQSLNTFTKMMYKRLTPAYKIRAKQAQLIEKEVNESKNPYVIVCGDFNDTPISYARHKIKGDLKDAFVESGSGLGITYNKYRFFFRIDYILHSRNIRSYNCSVGDLKNSDHYPVSCYLQFKD